MADLFKSPFYFLFVALIGYAGWAFSLRAEYNARPPVQKTDRPVRGTAATEQEAIGSEVYIDSVTELSAEDMELLRSLEVDEEEWSEVPEEDAAVSPFLSSPAEIESYLQSVDVFEQSFFADETAISSGAPKLDYEDEGRCGSERYRFSADLERATDLRAYLQTRADHPQFSKACIQHIMNFYTPSSRSLARCPKGAHGLPQFGGVKPCITKTMVQVTYNTYSDVADCFQFNPKDMLPKLFTESGFIMNSLGMRLDAGVGQFTSDGIRAVNNHIEKEIARLATSKRDSCRRLYDHRKLLAPVPHDESHRCSIIMPPENPLKNVFYMGLLNRLNADFMQKKFDNALIAQKFKQLGLKQANMNALRDAMVLLSYNIGSGGAFNALNTYLDKRLRDKLPVKIADFDFYNAKEEKDVDGKSKSVVTIARLNVTAVPIRKGAKDAALRLARAKELPNIIRSAHRRTFPEYLIYMQNNFDENQKILSKDYRVKGAPGYLSFIASKDQVLRDLFSNAGRSGDFCSNPQFLKVTGSPE
jgi:hypothetical protein